MKFILFDIDGTLVATGGAGKAALETGLAEEFGIKLRTGTVQYSGRTDRAIIRDLLVLHGLENSLHNLQRLLAAYLRHLPASLASHQGQVLPGIDALVQQLHERRDVTLGLLTGNVREGARLKLGHYGLFHYFPIGGFGDQHYERDDVAREALSLVSQRHGAPVETGRIWVIGDTPLDVQCARAIGARVVAVATGWHAWDELHASRPDLLMKDFTDPAPFLELLR
jgi:phosphoglycolate phosphatase-like HAD superfamily hydrolase